MELVILCDGGFKKVANRPGIATYGWVLRRLNRTRQKESGVVCWGRSAHNLMAEYGAVVAALRWALAAGLEEKATLVIRSDCRLVVERLNGQVRLKRMRGLVMLHMAAIRYAARLRRRGHAVWFEHVDRKLVAEAHRLCRVVYNQRLGSAGAPSGLQLRGFLRGRKRQNRAAAWLQRPAFADVAD